jgi:hypothetical protein
VAFVDKSVLKSLVQSLTGLTGVSVIWDPAEPRPFTDHVLKGQIRLKIDATSPIGTDNFYRVFDEDLDVNVVHQEGWRTFICKCVMESFDPDVDAYLTLETLRLKLVRPSSRAVLLAANMSFSYAEGTLDLPTTYDNRVVSVASLDLHMLGLDKVIDDSDDGNWIQTFEAAPTIA